MNSIPSLAASQHQYLRALITSDGIVIKNQNSGAGDDIEANSTRESSRSFMSGCFNCMDTDLDSDPSAVGLLPNNTVIPYRRILNAKTIGSDTSSSASDSVTGTSNVISNPFKNPNETNNTGFIESTLYENTSHLVEVTFVIPHGKDIIPKKLILSIDYIPTPTMETSNESEDDEDIVELILSRSFDNIKRKKSILVVINPYGGKGIAKTLYEEKCHPILAGTECNIDIAYTKYACHAMDIAKDLDINKYDTIACASGDGIPYEIINGLYQRPDRAEAFNKLTITQLPCGSGNAMSISCHWTNNPSYASLCLVKSVESRIDMMCCSQESYVNQFPRLSFLSQTYGVIAEADINTEFIRWMGPSRFDLGVALTILRGRKYPCDLYVKYAIKEKEDIHVHYIQHKNKAALVFDEDYSHNFNNTFQYIPPADHVVVEEDFKPQHSLYDQVPSDWEKVDQDITDNLQIFYTGKMPYMAKDTKFFPAALPADGTIDLVITDSRTPLTKITPILLSIDKGTHVMQPEVIHAKILAYRLVPKLSDSIFSVDGEKFPSEPLQVEILPRLVKTLLLNGTYIDSEFDSMV